jgi:Tfp pilus assembly PilM family ATPase
LPRFLALDWDHQRLHVVSATLRGGRIQIQRAAVWKEDQSPNPAEGEALGRLLRERLRDAGIAPAPVLACVSRDRVILKEVHYPQVPAYEEPAVVQFQVSKELTDAADEVVVDYAPDAETTTNGEQHALAVVIRRELLATYEAVCRGAGLKLAALTPRPFGMLACLKQVVGEESADAAVALLTVEEDGAEFCIVHRDRLLLSRSLAAGTTLAAEVRRSLAVYAAQGPQPPVRAVYVAGGEEHAPFRARLGDLLGIPVHPMDPFGGAQRPGIPGSDRGSFVSAVGLLFARAQRAELPVNFAQPKKPKPPRDVNKTRLIAAASVAAILVLGAVGYCSVLLAEKQHQLDAVSARKSQLERDLTVLEEEGNRIASLDDWNREGIVWLDELYDLTARFPDTDTIRLTAFTGAPLTHNTPAKRNTKPSPGSKASEEDENKRVAQLTLNGITTEDRQAVTALQERFVQDGHYGVDPKFTTRNTGPDRTRFQQQFTAHIQIEKPLPEKYMRKLTGDDEQDDRPTRNRGDRRRGGNGRGGNGRSFRRGGRP